MNLGMDLQSSGSSGSIFRAFVHYLIAPLLLSFSGFHTADFLLSGVYTWPRTSRIVVLTLAVLILSYEFVYKEPDGVPFQRSHRRSMKMLMSACVLPYILGVAILLVLSQWAG